MTQIQSFERVYIYLQRWNVIYNYLESDNSPFVVTFWKYFSRFSLPKKSVRPRSFIFLWFRIQSNWVISKVWKWFINWAAVWNESWWIISNTVQIAHFEINSISFFSFSFRFGFQMSKIKTIRLPENDSFPLF